MPIEFQIDHDRRLVSSKAVGKLAAEDLIRYQREVWSLPEVRGYDELIDMGGVGEIVSPDLDTIKDLVALSADMDDREVATKFAIVASDTFAHGMGQIYGLLRNINPRSTKKVRVFRTVRDARDWIETK
jgi:hypothetical protein